MAGIQLKNGVVNQFGAPSINENTLANRPTFGQTGRLFVDTTNNVLQRDTGTSWVQIGAVASTPNLQSVCAVGNTYSGDIAINLIAVGRGGTNNSVTNTLVGANSGNFQTTGINNVTIGYNIFAALSSGQNNVGIGSFAGNFNTQSNGTFIGANAGRYTTGGNNVIIGYNSDTGTAAFPNLFASNNVIIGNSIGTSTTQYSSYNVFIGDNTAGGYSGNGINGLNIVIGALLSVSATPTITGNIIMGNNGGKKIQMYASNNWVLGGGADNGIHQLQLSGGLYCQTLSPSGVTWAVNTTITLGSSNFYYVYTGAGMNTITLPTALGNNNIYTFINSTNMMYSISTSGGQFILRKNTGTLVTSFFANSYTSHQLIADGNNKFYEIV
jgi:hypothetical protein